MGLMTLFWYPRLFLAFWNRWAGSETRTVETNTDPLAPLEEGLEQVEFDGKGGPRSVYRSMEIILIIDHKEMSEISTTKG